jgi:hypothetical protein
VDGSPPVISLDLAGTDAARVQGDHAGAACDSEHPEVDEVGCRSRSSNKLDYAKTCPAVT